MDEDYISQLGLNTGKPLPSSTGTTAWAAPMLPGLAATYAPATAAGDKSLWDSFKGSFGSSGTGKDGTGGTGIMGTLSDKNLMSGLQGVGTLGLGLADYMAMKPVYEEQLAGLKQNRQQAAENHQNRKNIASDLA